MRARVPELSPVISISPKTTTANGHLMSIYGPATSLSYDIVAHDDGWAIVVTPERTRAFATKIDAYDAAVEFARKLRFVGYTVHVHVNHGHDRPLQQAS